MADATFTITLTVTGATQQLANEKRDLALLDFCNALRLDINTNGVPDAAKVATETRAAVRRYVKETIIDYRARNSVEGFTATETTNLGNL